MLHSECSCSDNILVGTPLDENLAPIDDQTEASVVYQVNSINNATCDLRYKNTFVGLIANNGIESIRVSHDVDTGDGQIEERWENITNGLPDDIDENTIIKQIKFTVRLLTSSNGEGEESPTISSTVKEITYDLPTNTRISLGRLIERYDAANEQH